MPLSRLSSSGGFENAGDCVVPIHFLDSQNSPGKLQTVEKVDSTKIQPSWRSLFAFTTRADCISMVCSGAGSFLTGVLKPTAAIFFGQIFSVLTEFGGGTLDAKDMLHGISIWCIALTALGISVWFTEGIFFSSWIIFGENQAKVVREKTFAALLDKEQEWYDLRDDGIGSLLIRIQT
jgi:ATP-binding cassette subfamily B (MDR/TAP) protein 1